MIIILASSPVTDEIIKEILLDVVEKVCMSPKSTKMEENVRADNDFDMAEISLQQESSNEHSSFHLGKFIKLFIMIYMNI